MSRLVVLGGGITGLAAAWEASHEQRVEVIVLESDERIGGKIRTSPIDDGVGSVSALAVNDVADGELLVGEKVIDEGADAFLARVPDAVQLCRELGLEDELTQPAIGRAQVFVDGQLRFLPSDTVLGVPLDFDALAASGLVSPEGVERARQEPERDWSAPVGDVSIGEFLTERYGREVVENVVAPLIGGINAGQVDHLSLAAVTPQLADAAADGGSLTEALRRRVPPTPLTTPVFHALLGGTERLIQVLADALRARGVTIETGVRALGCSVSQGAVHVDVTRGDAGTNTVTTDEMVVCTPARSAARILGSVSSDATAALDAITYSSVALVTFVFDRDDLPGPLDASGFLVPHDAGLLLTAASIGSSKWTHWDDGRHVVLRVSAGHAGDDRGIEFSDADLVHGLQADLHTTMGISAAPLAARISRWPDGFAQYQIGHLDRVAAIEAALERDCPQIRVAGASYRGLGIPACIRQGRNAVRALFD